MKRGKKQKKAESTLKLYKKDKIIEPETKQYNYFFNVWILLGLIIIIGIIAFQKYFTGEYLFFFKDIGSDTINQNYPGLVHKVALLQEGFFSKWSFYKGLGSSWVSGFPVEPYGLLRTLEQQISLKLFGVNSFVSGRFIRIFIYYFLLSGLISYFYFRTISIKKYSSLIGALLITFSGFMVVGSGWGFSSHIFKAVFLLLSFEQLYLKKRWYFFPFAIIWLSGNPFVLYLYSFFLLLYSIFRYFSENKNRLKGYFLLLGKMGLLGFIGLMMNFSSLFKGFMKMYFSPRVAGNSSYSNILESGQEITDQASLFGTTILRFFSNDILGSGSNFYGWNNYFEAPLLFIGLLTLIVFPQVFVQLNKRKKIIFGSYLGFWFLTLFFPYLRYIILAFTGDYFRYGFDFFVPFTLLFYSIFALNNLDNNFKLNLPLLGGTLLGLIVLLFVPYTSISEVYINKDIRKIIALFLVLYSGLLFLMSKPKFKIISQYSILLLLVVELSYFSYQSYVDRVPITNAEFNKNKAGYADGSIKAVNYIKSIDKTLFYRIEKDYQSGSSVHGSLNDALAQGYYGTTSYASFNQLNYVRFLEGIGLIQKGDEIATRWITGLRGYPLLQTFANVKYHLSKSKTPEFLKFGFDSIARKEEITILKNRYNLPFGYTYDKYIDADDFKTLINYKITAQSLSNIYTDLSRTVDVQNLNLIINKLQTILNVKYSNLNTFYKSLDKLLGKDIAFMYKLIIAKYSVSNFKVQTALLNGFVYEKNEDLNISELEKINISDSSKIIPVTMFNFDVYKNITDNLKQDTFQIESFKQSEIRGTINLNKTKLLFLTIPFDEGWKIKVNNKVKKLIKVNIGFTGIVLPKGISKIELYYIPKYSVLTKTISIISISVFWIFLFFRIYKSKLKTINKKKDN